MTHDLTPMQVLEILVGKPDEIAKVCKMRAKGTYAWRYASGWHDAGDVRSARYMRDLLTYSDQHDLGLRARWLIFGASREEVSALLLERGLSEAAVARLLPVLPTDQVAAE